MPLTAEQIRSKKRGNSLPRKELYIPEWEDTVFVRELTAGDKDSWEMWQVRHKGVNWRAALVVRTVCDAEGNRLFQDSDVGEVAELSAAALSRIIEVAQELNRVTKEDRDDYEKNSVAQQDN